MEISIREGNIDEFDEIAALYQSVMDQEGCTWSEDYPSLQMIQEDVESGRLYCGFGEKSEIISAFAFDSDPVVDALPCWSKDITPVFEIMRLVVKREYQNQGIARIMLTFGMEELKKRGFLGVHFLVSQTNERAIRSYEKLHFQNVGEAFLFDNDWYCYELKF